jgi:hypothetical protein
MEKNVKWNVVLDCEAVWKATESQDGHSRGPEKQNHTKGLCLNASVPLIYKLPSFDNAEGSTVCKTFFKQTLRDSDGKIYLTLKKQTTYS